jgi:hypothetical protein
VEVDHAAAKAVFVDQFEFQSEVVGQGTRAGADYGRDEEEMALVDQSGPQRLTGQIGTADT